jgi:flavorubredoxin
VPTQALSADLPREVAPGVWWLGACVTFQLPDHLIHGHNSTYLVVGAERGLMVDTGSPSNWNDIEQVLEDKLDGKPLSYVFPSHPELPHTGNLPRLVAKYPDVEIVGDIRDYHLFFPTVTGNLREHRPGDRFDLGGGTEFVICEALILDLPNTQWGYVPSAKTLFTTDGFCYMHRPELDDEDPMHLPGECGLTTSELREPPTVENAAFFSGSALYWARFIDDADVRYQRVIDFVHEIDAQVLCPTHGNVITDVDEVMAIVRQGHKQSYRYHEPAGAGSQASAQRGT